MQPAAVGHHGLRKVVAILAQALDLHRVKGPDHSLAFLHQAYKAAQAACYHPQKQWTYGWPLLGLEDPDGVQQPGFIPFGARRAGRLPSRPGDAPPADGVAGVRLLRSRERARKRRRVNPLRRRRRVPGREAHRAAPGGRGQAPGRAGEAEEGAGGARRGRLAMEGAQALTFSQKKDPGDVLFRNISQSAARVIMSTVHDGKHVAPTQLPSQLLWIQPGLAASGQVASKCNVGRLLTGREALMMQGYPVPLVKEAVATTSESLMADLAGNGMAVPVVLAILVSASISLSWRNSDASEARQSTSEELESVTALLSMFASSAAAEDDANLRPKMAKAA